MAKVVYRKSGRRAAYPLVVVGALFLFGGALLNLFWPKRTRIELENRSTARFPAFSLASMVSGKLAEFFFYLDAGPVYAAGPVDQYPACRR